MAIGIIDLLKIVDIQHHDGDGLMLSSGFQNCPIKFAHNSRAICETGQAINICSYRKLLMGLLQLFIKFGNASGVQRQFQLIHHKSC